MANKTIIITILILMLPMAAALVEDFSAYSNFKEITMALQSQEHIQRKRSRNHLNSLILSLPAIRISSLNWALSIFAIGAVTINRFP